jgi:outer membrane protein assembly factor BamB
MSMRVKNPLSIFVLITILGLLVSGCSSLPVEANARSSTPLVDHVAYDWLQFDGNPQHSGENSLEILIHAGNVAQLKPLFQVPLPGKADGAPVVLVGVSTSNGVKTLVFLTTTDGRILALDAKTGSLVWSKQYGPGSCKINNGSSACYTTSSPAIDPNRQFVYSYGLDGYVHKYQVGDGTEVTSGDWPELTTLKGYNEKGSPPLVIATAGDGTSYLYAANGGYPGDQGDYQGHITVINLSTGAQNVFNAMCSDQAVHFVETPGTPDCAGVQSAIWARAPVIYDADTGKIYSSTGNGTFSPSLHDWGDSVFALNPDSTGAQGNPLDSYTPTNFQSLQNGDLDLGSTAPAILPAPASSSVAHLAVQSGKDAKLRLINLDNLSGQGGPGHTGGEISIINVPQGGQVLTQPAVWTNPADGSTWVFVGNGNGISGLKLTVSANGTPVLGGSGNQWMDKGGSAGSSTSPIIAGNVLYYAGSTGIHALNPLTGASLWSDTGIAGIHWESPVVAGGILYITDESSHLTAYSLNGQLPPVLDYQAFIPWLAK